LWIKIHILTKMDAINILLLYGLFLSILKMMEVGAIILNCYFTKTPLDISSRSTYTIWACGAYILTYIFK
jgi:hypothetical protein